VLLQNFNDVIKIQKQKSMRKLKYLFYLAFGTILLTLPTACNKDEQLNDLNGETSDLSLQTLDASLAATFTVKPIFIIGSTLASVDVTIAADGGSAITERGICWGTAANPTITDNKVVDGGVGIGNYRSRINGLTERTTYNVRAYTISAEGVSYSGNQSFRTIGKGNVTYTFNKASNPTAEQLAAYARLQIAIDSAVWYANNYTSAVKHVWVNYDPAVPTADANNEGWMRFGASSSYQNLRTMLHEMNHTFGTGTTSWWSGTAISGGKYQPSNANLILQQINNNTTAQLSGDSQHWWPYGLNQNSEVSSSWDYVYNCLIIEAMRKDGLPAAGTYNP
jgi:hypothetical protein